jgi:hypothetical protein
MFYHRQFHLWQDGEAFIQEDELIPGSVLVPET